MRFCMVTTFYPPYHFGGDGVFVYRLSHALADRGHEVTVLHSEDAFRLQHGGEPAVSFEEHPRVVRRGLSSRWPMVKSLAMHQLGRPDVAGSRVGEYLDSERFDVVHYHNTSLMGGPGVLRHGRGVKLYTPHEYWLVCPTHVLFKFNRRACTRKHCLACTLWHRRPPQLWRYTGLRDRCLRHVDALLMPSRFAMEQHRSGGVERPMVHLPHFVDVPVDEAPAASEVRGPYFLCAGRLERLKGFQEVIELFRSFRRAELVIAGEGTFGSVLRRAAAGLPHVKFLGAVHPRRLVDLYRAATAVIVPSLCYETFGLTAAEALACGTPVLVRRIGALPEIVDDSGGGFVFETMEECQAAMERLCDQPALRRELGAKGLEAARRLWTVEAHLARYLDIVDGVRSGATALEERFQRPAGGARPAAASA